MLPHPCLATIFGLSTGELVVILLIILLLFGGANLPKLTRSLGKSVKEFKNAVKEEDPPQGDGQGSGKDAPPPQEKP
jgi:sec-independent protein translocase protein TatA